MDKEIMKLRRGRWKNYNLEEASEQWRDDQVEEGMGMRRMKQQGDETIC
jgi:hypothetical protein